jgi:hypothetical protein
MAEFLFDEDEDRVQFVEPDPYGFTLRTRFKNTSEVLDRNQALRNSAPTTYREAGVDFHHAGSIPMEVWEKWCLDLGRQPTAKEALEFLKQRDYSKLRTSERKL